MVSGVAVDVVVLCLTLTLHATPAARKRSHKRPPPCSLSPGKPTERAARPRHSAGPLLWEGGLHPGPRHGELPVGGGARGTSNLWFCSCLPYGYLSFVTRKTSEMQNWHQHACLLIPISFMTRNSCRMAPLWAFAIYSRPRFEDTHFFFFKCLQRREGQVSLRPVPPPLYRVSVVGHPVYETLFFFSGKRGVECP